MRALNLFTLLYRWLVTNAPSAAAQVYRCKPLRMNVPQGGGGSTDSLTCSLAKAMSDAALRDHVPGTHRHMHRTTVLDAPSGELYQGDRRIATRNQRRQACDQSSKPYWPA